MILNLILQSRKWTLGVVFPIVLGLTIEKFPPFFVHKITFLLLDVSHCEGSMIITNGLFGSFPTTTTVSQEEQQSSLLSSWRATQEGSRGPADPFSCAAVASAFA